MLWLSPFHTIWSQPRHLTVVANTHSIKPITLWTVCWPCEPYHIRVYSLASLIYACLWYHNFFPIAWPCCAVYQQLNKLVSYSSRASPWVWVWVWVWVRLYIHTIFIVLEKESIRRARNRSLASALVLVGTRHWSENEYKLKERRTLNSDRRSVHSHSLLADSKGHHSNRPRVGSASRVNFVFLLREAARADPDILLSLHCFLRFTLLFLFPLGFAFASTWTSHRDDKKRNLSHECGVTRVHEYGHVWSSFHKKKKHSVLPRFYANPLSMMVSLVLTRARQWTYLPTEHNPGAV